MKSNMLAELKKAKKELEKDEWMFEGVKLPF